MKLCLHTLMKVPGLKKVIKWELKTKGLRNLYKDFGFYCNPPEIMLYTVPCKSALTTEKKIGK